MTDAELDILTEEMDHVDLDLFDAERAGDAAGQARLLRERAGLWRRYGRLRESAGRESTGAELSAQRDEITARQLERGAR
ncbi:MAG: hypothetical protein ACRDRY_17775 [Pseudonocardiaceae bacterium]